MIYRKQQHSFISGYTLKNPAYMDDNNTALHTGLNQEYAINNRHTVADTLHLPLTSFVFANQTHSDHIQKITKLDKGKGAFDIVSAIDDCDALYTKDPDIVLVVAHADCVPILIFDTTSNLICAIHAGWKSSAKGIVFKAIEKLKQDGLQLATTYIEIGPCIQGPSFEIDTKILDEFIDLPISIHSFIFDEKDGKAHLDLAGLHKQSFIQLGIQDKHITISPKDTYHDQQCFSYRRNKTKARHMSFIVRIS